MLCLRGYSAINIIFIFKHQICKNYHTRIKFKAYFRMSTTSFDVLTQFLTSKMPEPVLAHGGCEPLSFDEMLYITLWYMANQYTLREIALLFNRYGIIYLAIDAGNNLLTYIGLFPPYGAQLIK